jgi:hypothetical protein
VIAPSDHFERFPAEIIKQEITGTNLRTAPFQQTVAQIAVCCVFATCGPHQTEMQSTSENGFECLASTGVKSPANAVLERLAPIGFPA